MFVFVGHGGAPSNSDSDVGVVPVSRFLYFLFVCFALAVVGIKASGGFFFGQPIAVSAELAIEGVEPVFVSGKDVVIAGLRAVVAVALLEAKSLLGKKAPEGLAGEGGYFIRSCSHHSWMA